ncbi:hypothetical protein Tco_0426033 [Tanacetum coccineum]
MSTQQDIYATGSENRPPMLNKENYVPWSSRLLRYAKSRPNGKLIYNSIMNGPYVRRMIPEPAEIKQMEADDQEIQTILLGLPEDIYAAVDSCETAQEIWLRVQQMMKGSDIGIQEKKAKLFNEWERFTSTDGESIESYYHRFSNLMNDFKRNKHFPKKIASNLKFLNNLQPEWSRHVTIVHQTKDLHTTDYTQLYEFLKYNQKEVDELRAERRAKSQDPLALMANSNNSFKGLGHLVRNCTFRPRRRDAAYLQTQLLIAQKEEARIQLQAEEFDLMAAAVDLDEIEEVNANYILMANLQQASTSGTQSDNAPVYDTDGSAEPIPEPHQVPQNDSNVICEVSSVEQGGGTVEQHYANVKETHAYHESLFHNLAAKVEKVNSVNRKMKEKNAELTTELSRYKNQERCFEISQEKYEKLERCYQRSVYQQQCISKKINALYLSSGKQITALNEEISNLNKQLLKEKLTVYSLQEEKKRLKYDFKIRKDELLDKQIQLENKQAQQKQQSLYNGKVLLEKHDPPTVYDSEETLELAQETYNDMQQKIKRLQAQLGDQKGKSKDTPCVSDTLDPLFQKHENENVELKFQIRNYEKENAHLMAVYKNLFDSINVTRTQTKPIIDSLQNKLHDMIYENAKLRAQLFEKVSEQKDTTRGTSANTKFAKQSILGIPPSSSRPKLYAVTPLPKSTAIPKVGETNALSNQVTSNSVPSSQELKVMENDNVIAPGMFRIDPSNTSRENKFCLSTTLEQAFG